MIVMRCVSVWNPYAQPPESAASWSGAGSPPPPDRRLMHVFAEVTRR